MRNIRVVKPYVYVVYECSDYQVIGDNFIEGKIHGIYLNKEEVEGKRDKLKRTNIIEGYIAVLKKPLHGADILDKKGIKVIEKVEK